MASSFQVDPLQLPAPIRPAQIDWGGFNQIGDAIAAGRRKQAIGEAAAASTDASGKIDQAKFGTKLAELGYHEEARPMLALAQQQAALAQSAQFHQDTVANQKAHLDLARDQFNATQEGQRVPAGFTRGGDGGLVPVPGGPADPAYLDRVNAVKGLPGFARGPDNALTPIPGGPADPAYLERATQAKEKPRQFSVTDVSKLSEEGGKFAGLTDFEKTFEPRFAGYGSETIGNAATFMGRYVPSLTSKDTVDAANFWQGYDRFKNVTRNELFGAALTKSEQAAFEKADINPGMDPKLIQTNLARQSEIARNGIKRKANALIQSGYDPAAISAAYGLSLDQLGVAPRRGGVPAAAPASAPAPSAPNIPPPPPGFQLVK